MLKKINLVLILAFVSIFLIGCNGEEHTANSGIEVRIIEDFDLHGLDIPPYILFGCEGRILGLSDSIQVFNGLTGELENIIESDIPRGCVLQPYGDYYLIVINHHEGLYVPNEYFILDQDFNLLEEFKFSRDDAIVIFSRRGFSPPQRIGQNEVGEWLGYIVGSDGEIYTYNFLTHEIVQIAHLNGMRWEVFLMPDINKLAFMLMNDFDWQEGIMFERIEFGFIDLVTHEMTMMYEIENVRGPYIHYPLRPVPMGEFLLATFTSSEEQQEREALMIYPLTGEVRTILIREDDFSWRGDENYSRWIFDVSTTLDGRWLLMQAQEYGEMIEDWCFSNATSKIRLYDTQTTELIFEHLLIDEDTLKLGESPASLASIIQLEENIYLIRQPIGTGRTMEQSFVATDMRFEYIVIEIVVHDDE